MRTKRRNLSVQDWEESSSERMLGQCSDCSTAQTHVQPSTETWAKTAREELWLCPCHAQVSRALLSASGGHAKPPSAPSLFPHSHISRDAAKPLLNSGAASSRGSLGLTRARQALPRDERRTRCITPSSPPPALALPAKSAAPQPPGAPRAGEAGLPARHNTNQMMYSKPCQYAHPQERGAGRGEGGKQAGWSFHELCRADEPLPPGQR